MHRFLHTAETVGQQRLHHQQGQVDAQRQQVGAEEGVQDGIRRQIHHGGAAAVDKGAGQQLLFQLFGLRALVPQGAQTAEQAGQHPRGRQQQGHGYGQHHGVSAAGGQHHQRSQAHALHDDRVVFEDTVMVCELFGVTGDHFCNVTFHSASSFQPSRRYRRVSVRSSQPEMLLTVSSAKQTPVS